MKQALAHPNKGLVSGRCVGWSFDEQLAIDMCAMLIANHIPATIRAEGQQESKDSWSIDVVDIKHRGHARELIRGFKAALPVRGHPSAFVQGVVSGFYYKYKSEPEKLAPLQNVKLLPGEKKK